MSDRLTELQRQRAIIQGHLAWLDQEITAASGSARIPILPMPTVSSKPEPFASATTNQADDELLAKFNVDPKGAATSARKGCILAFALILALLSLTVYGLYQYSRSLHQNAAPPAEKITPGTPAKR